MDDNTLYPLSNAGETQNTASSMNLAELADLCGRELKKTLRGEPCDGLYGLEIFRRAMLQHDEYAWVLLHQLFNGYLLSWMRRHPHRAEACLHDSEENYVFQAFERLWQASINDQKLEFSTLSGALSYLKASLNGAILDRLRPYWRSKEIPLPEPGHPEEPVMDAQNDAQGIWEIIQNMLPGQQERRLAYFLFHYGLKPREIIRYFPREFSNVKEIYRLRRNIYDRLLRNADQIRWRLHDE